MASQAAMTTVSAQVDETDPPRRRKGRPLKASNGVGRKALVEAARELLKQTPPGRLTRAQVAERATADPALIRYYFGDMPGLLTAVVEAIHKENLGRLRALLREPGSPTEKLRRRVRLVLQMHVENPYYHQLIFEQLWQGQRETQRRIGQELVTPYYGEFRKLVLEGQRTGLFRKVDPRLVHVATLSLCELFINAPYVLQHLYRIDRITPAMIDHYGDFVAELLIEGIRAKAD